MVHLGTPSWGLLLLEQEEKLEFLVRFLQPWSRTLCEDNNDAAAARVLPVVWRIVCQEQDEETRSLFYYHRHHLPPSSSLLCLLRTFNETGFRLNCRTPRIVHRRPQRIIRGVRDLSRR